MVKETDRQDNIYSRRTFLNAALAMPAIVSNLSSRLCQPNLSEILSAISLVTLNGDISIISPDGHINFQLLARDVASLSYRVLFRKQPAIETSLMGIIVDGVNLGEGVRVSHVETYKLNESYPTRGVHSEAV